MPILPRFIKEYAPRHRTSPTTGTGLYRRPSLLRELSSKIVNIKVSRDNSKTSSSYTETLDPGKHFQQGNLPEGRGDNAVDEKDERYMSLSSVEHGEPVRTSSLTRSENWPL